MYWRTLLRWTAPQIWHFACGKRIPSQAKLWIYVPVIPNTHTHTLLPPVAMCRKKPLKKNDISTGHKINSQTLWERHSQAVLPMLRTPRTMSRRNVKLGGKRHLWEIPGPKKRHTSNVQWDLWSNSYKQTAEGENVVDCHYRAGFTCRPAKSSVQRVNWGSDSRSDRSNVMLFIKQKLDIDICI